MPELPEVEHAARRLAHIATGKRIVALRTLHPAVARGLSPGDLSRVEGRTVDLVERRGKHQLVHLGDDVVLIAHFRMTGDWHDGPADAPPRFARAVLEFTDGSAIFLVDSRAFATLVVRTRGEEGIPALGVDAASPALDGPALQRALARRRGPIKPALLDQAVIAGLGNISAAEALWHARVSPFAAASSVEPHALAALAAAIRHTIALAMDDPGRYSRGEGIERLAVYGREGEPCLRCAAPIVRVAQAGRSTFYCPDCQPAPGR
jgi:formamidopyrimidine-DNA glycosylase